MDLLCCGETYKVEYTSDFDGSKIIWCQIKKDGSFIKHGNYKILDNKGNVKFVKIFNNDKEITSTRQIYNCQKPEGEDYQIPSNLTNQTKTDTFNSGTLIHQTNTNSVMHSNGQSEHNNDRNNQKSLGVKIKSQLIVIRHLICLLNENGQLFCQLSLNGKIDSPIPIQIQIPSPIVTIFRGESKMYALTTDGLLYYLSPIPRFLEPPDHFVKFFAKTEFGNNTRIKNLDVLSSFNDFISVVYEDSTAQIKVVEVKNQGDFSSNISISKTIPVLVDKNLNLKIEKLIFSSDTYQLCAILSNGSLYCKKFDVENYKSIESLVFNSSELFHSGPYDFDQKLLTIDRQSYRWAFTTNKDNDNVSFLYSKSNFNKPVTIAPQYSDCVIFADGKLGCIGFENNKQIIFYPTYPGTILDHSTSSSFGLSCGLMQNGKVVCYFDLKSDGSNNGTFEIDFTKTKENKTE